MTRLGAKITPSPVGTIMQEAVPSRRVIRFGVFDLDLGARQLCKNGVRVKLQDQPFEILTLLVQRAGEVVTREVLRQKLWPEDTFVDFDHSLNTAIKKLRDALDDSAESPRFIETLPRHGYRFIAPVEEARAAAHVAEPAMASPAPAAAPPPASVAVLRRVRFSPALAALFLFLLAFGYFGWRRFRPPATAHTERIMLAVLPFENLSGDPKQEYFSDGLTEEMIAQLSRFNPERLRVIARTSAMQYKGVAKTAAQIGRELGVDYILESSVRREQNRMRITTQLVRVSDQTHLWSQSYERDARGVLTLQKDIANEVATQIAVKLNRPAAERPATMPNLDAYEAYLKGRFFWNKRSEQGHLKAIKYFDQAIAEDPGYAQAYSGLADAYALLGSNPTTAITRQEAMARARAAALKALAIDDTLAEAHTSLAFIYWHYDWNWPAAEKEFQRALQLNPGYPTAHHWYAYYFVSQGRLDQALEEIRRAQETDPLSLIINTDVAEMLCFAQHYDQAIAQAKRVLEMDPEFALARRTLAWSYWEKHQYGTALEEAKKGVQIPGANPDMEATLAITYAAMGQNAQARDLLLKLKLESERQHTQLSPPIAQVYAALGEKDEAFAWLEKDFQDRNGGLTLLKVAPYYDSLRADPRFTDLVRRIGLPQ